MRVVWTDEAWETFEEVIVGLATFSDELANTWAGRIVARAKSLQTLAMRGHIFEKRQGGDLRQVWEGPFRILYRVVDDDVEILLVLHGARLVRF